MVIRKLFSRENGILRWVVSVLLFTVIATPARAQVSASVLYTETHLGDGLWRYDYRVSNLTNPVLGAEYNLFDLSFLFDPTATVIVSALPEQWDHIADDSAIEAFAVAVGAPPVGVEIAPGETLAGFSLIYNYRAGDTAYTALFVNPVDANAPFEFNGMTMAAPSGAVPEPGTWALYGAGLILLAGRRCRKQRISSS